MFVHGLTDQARSFAMVMARLVDAGFRCVAYELPNGPATGPTSACYRHPHYVADLIALLDHLTSTRPTCSARRSARRSPCGALATHPDRFRRGVLQGRVRPPAAAVDRARLARLGRYWPWRMGELARYRLAMTRLDGPGFSRLPAGGVPVPADVQRADPGPGRRPAALMLDTLDLRPLLPRDPAPGADDRRRLRRGSCRGGARPRWSAG